MLKEEADIRKILQEYCKGRQQGEVAKSLGISQQYLSLMLSGTRKISKKVASVLGYKKITLFKSENSEK